jgi:3'-phosphoadenosine 5'-phosphosulfate sulfotransferase (PAPS reductase)/FAD synthetase
VTDALFSEVEVYDGDPLNPDLDTPTPPSVIAALTRLQREQRVTSLVEQAYRIYDQALDLYLGNRELVARCILFSGGNDSTTLAHLFRGRATHAIHANTTIGIEETRQFVRDTCATWDLPLIETTGGTSYRDLVLGLVTNRNGGNVWQGGFPGPGAHWLMYQRLKERALDQARHLLGFANSRSKAGAFIAGRRRLESDRREDVPLHEPDGSVIWISPIANWSKLDLNTYRLMTGDVPTNPVTEKLHMSGECLCGAFAHPGELDELRYWYPAVAAEIDQLRGKLLAAGYTDPYATWGHGQGAPSRSGRLCSSCTAKQGVLFP